MRSLKAIIIGLSLAIPFAATTQAAAPQVRTQAPGYYRMMLGQFEITALLDGTHTFPVTKVMLRNEAGNDGTRRAVHLSEAHPGEAEALLAAERLSLPLEGAINAFLINTGHKLVLIDSGAGSLYGDCCGHLITNLIASGYKPEQVDEIYITHLHADHVGGIAPNGKAAFPNAIVRVNQTDIDYWLDPASESKAAAFLKPMFEGDRASLKPYQDSGRLRPFKDGEQLSPGIRAIPTAGHTPGHTSYEVTSGNARLLVWGDLVHVAPIQFRDPAITLTYDSDPFAAEARRAAIFSDASTNGTWIAAAHIAFPGLGHVVPSGSRFAWIPASYTTLLTPTP